ncbi:MAG: response regulator [Magnetococcales bacterium]|nr:response regulator [Magnetococcales bacterium]
MDHKVVLVVDDSSLSRLMFKGLISNHLPEWEVIEAKNADEALNVLRKHQPAFAFVDYHMPGMDGLALAREMVALHPSLVIHLVTANVHDSLRDAALAQGFGYINKPITEAKLAAIFREMA